MPQTLSSNVNTDQFCQGLQWMIYDSFKIFMGLPTTGEGLTIDSSLRMEP